MTRLEKICNFVSASEFVDQSIASFINTLVTTNYFQSLGNHEVTYGLRALKPFLEDATFPVLLANVNNSANHVLWQSKEIRNSVVLDVKGVRVGVIGYLTPDTPITADFNLELTPEVDAIK